MGEPTGATKGFVDWILSEEGQAEVSRADTVNLEEGKTLETQFRHWPANKSLIRNH